MMGMRPIRDPPLSREPCENVPVKTKKRLLLGGGGPGGAGGLHGQPDALGWILEGCQLLDVLDFLEA